MNLRLWGVFLMVVVGWSSCLKKDNALKLPPKTGSNILQVFMGPKPYDTTVFVSLEKNKVVKSIRTYDWDLRFDATETGLAILMNTGKNMRALNTRKKSLNIVYDTVGHNANWGFDVCSNLKDSAFLNSWHTQGSSNLDVYILRMGDEDFTKEKYYKLQIMSANASGFYISFDTLNGNNTHSLFIPKDASKNFSYCSINGSGKVLNIEPDKTTWDICFTRYSTPFYFTVPFLYYPVNGVLLNTYNTSAWGDTVNLTNFTSFSLEQAVQKPLIKNEDVIGYNWKNPNGPNFSFVTEPKFMYLIKTQREELYKLHFLDFYYQGVGGAPLFEYERLK